MDDVASFLRGHPPFDSLDDDWVAAVAVYDTLRRPNFPLYCFETLFSSISGEEGVSSTSAGL